MLDPDNQDLTEVSLKYSDKTSNNIPFMDLKGELPTQKHLTVVIYFMIISVYLLSKMSIGKSSLYSISACLLHYFLCFIIDKLINDSCSISSCSMS